MKAPGSLLVAALTALVLAGAAHPEIPVLRATVVEQTSVTLVDAAVASVTQLAPGAYTVVVDDRSSTDNFHLSGPGVNLDSGLTFEGSRTWEVTLGDGPYTFVSDTRAETMRGAFVVGTVPPVRLRATVTDGSIALEGGPVQPGTYAIEVDDRSRLESFRLVGPGVELHTQRHTAFKVTWLVTLAEGTYHFFSDRRPDALCGTLVVGAGGAAGTGTTLRAVTGSDFAIALVGEDNAPVTRLDRGTYTIAIDDRSPDHNFHLVGPGIDRETTLAAVGQQTWTVRVTGGTYSFFCNPHTLTMTGRFSAPRAPAVRLRATLTAVGARLRNAAGKPVQTLAPGPYVITVIDRSKRAGFVLRGPGLTRATSRAFVGTTTWKVDLAPGTYRYGLAARPRTLRVA
jgi:hypothetical protein